MGEGEKAMIRVLSVTAVGLACTALRLYEEELRSLFTSRPAFLKTLDPAGADPVIGRDDEIDRVICILCGRTKNCAVLVGAAGVGKTAIVEGLAQRIAAGAVPAALAGARVAELDVGAMVAGTQWRGMFEQRLKDAIKLVEDARGKLILFIDEMHMIVGAGDRDGTGDAANILKPALARGRIRCIGATTSEEYRRYIQKDAALDRRFQRVDVEEPSVPATVAILQGLKHRYQDHHGLTIRDDALAAAAQLAGRYITGRQFPDKAIDLMDEACTTVKLHKQKEVQNKDTNTINAPEELTVGPCHIAQVVSRWTKIPITTLGREEEKLSHLADRLHERIVGQYEAVNLVAQEVLRSRVGFDQSGQPIGSFLFLGPAGVGKTELAKALADKLFDNEKALVRFDMSEYADSGSVLRLIGGPRSYEEDGQLTEKVRSQPYSVVLFDEADKAHPSIFKVLIQLLDDGMLVDGKGRNINFKNTIIIMSSTLGAENLSARMAGENIETARDLLRKQVEKRFKPEFLNKLSEIVMFEPLSHDELRKITRIQMKRVIDTAAYKGISLLVTDAALDVIWSEAHDTVYGARPIKRWMKKNVTRVLVDMLVNGEACQGSTISIDAADDNKELKYQVQK
ncbi:chaperone protein ClpB1-like [Triticum dicoccoides]|uniref:chaperone protein ClpB1-like n=1 Tax=Triticum dicoccoides TaxID=85692 RepID=UPI00188EDF27|nr:chaperone protein ClpB1-like [Triticum dicoccoides]